MYQGMVMYKYYIYLIEMTSPTRGNYQIDEGEECDAGSSGDACCSSEFKYTPGSDCS